MTNNTKAIIEEIEAIEEKGTKGSINRLREIMSRNDRREFRDTQKPQGKKFVYTTQRWS